MPKSPFSRETNFPFRRGVGGKEKKSPCGSRYRGLVFRVGTNKADSVLTAWPGGWGSHVNFIFRSTGSEQRRGEFDLRPVFRKNSNPAVSSALPRRSWSFLSPGQQFLVGAWWTGLARAGKSPPTGVRDGFCHVGAFPAHAFPASAGFAELKGKKAPAWLSGLLLPRRGALVSLGSPRTHSRGRENPGSLPRNAGAGAEVLTGTCVVSPRC